VEDKIAQPVRRLFGETEDVSGNIFYPDTFFSNLISCYNCVSVWVGLLCCVILVVYPYLLLPIFFSGVALLVETLRG